MQVDDFIDLYRAEIKGGKFWGVAHDLFIIKEKFGMDANLLDTVLPEFYHRKGTPKGYEDLFKAR